MKSLNYLIRVVVVAAVSIAASVVENPAKAHIIPRPPVTRPTQKLPPPPAAKPDITDWTGPTRQATIWR